MTWTVAKMLFEAKKRFRFTYTRVIRGWTYKLTMTETDGSETTSGYQTLSLEIESLCHPEYNGKKTKKEWIILLTVSILAFLHLSQVAEVISFHLVIEDFALMVSVTVGAAGNEILVQDFLQQSERGGKKIIRKTSRKAQIDECRLCMGWLTTENNKGEKELEYVQVWHWGVHG